jgi:Uncharacterized protein conserved in bacteria (DUF2188)
MPWRAPTRCRHNLSMPRRYFVSKRNPRAWAVKRAGAKRATAITRTQKAGEKLAKRLLKKAGGGEATIKNRRGKIRDSDTVKRGNDPRSRRDTRH